MKATKLRDFVVKAAEDMKGQDVVTLDIQKLSTIADYMLVVTGTSTRHVRSIADEMEKRCKEQGIPIKGMEGAIGSKRVTYDFARLMDGATELKTSEFGDNIIQHM